MRLHVPTRLRWSDLDAYGHVNNAEMLRLLEEARIEAFWVADDGDRGQGGAEGAGGDAASDASATGGASEVLGNAATDAAAPDAVAPGAPSAMAVLDGRPGSGTLSLIARQEIEYLAQIPYLRQPLDIQLWLGRLGGASLDVCYEVWSPEGVDPRVLFTRAATTLVLVDAATARPRRISGTERAAWSPYIEAPLAFSRRR